MKPTRQTTAFTALPEFRSLSNWSVPANGEVVPETHDHEAKIAAALADGYARGAQVGRSECQAECDTRIAELEREYSERIEHAREEWTRNFSEQVIGGLLSMKAEIVQSLSDQVALVLEPLVKEKLRENAINLLAAAATQAIDNGTIVRIRAPQVAVQQIEAGLAGCGAQIEWEISDMPEISLQIDNTRIQLAFESWLADLEGVGS